MKVKELIKELSQYPGNMDVFMAERKTEFSYGLVNSVSNKEINFMEEPDGEVLCRYNVIVIDEE